MLNDKNMTTSEDVIDGAVETQCEADAASSVMKLQSQTQTLDRRKRVKAESVGPQKAHLYRL